MAKNSKMFHSPCSPHQLKKGHPPLFPAEKAIGLKRAALKKKKKYKMTPSYFMHLNASKLLHMP
jgi:hypothetical protein